MTSVTKHVNCPKCGKPAMEVSRLKFGKETMIKLVCGHSLFQKQLDAIAAEEERSLRSFLTGHTPFEYQLDTLDFINQAGGRVGIFHEQGLGKTICACLALRTHQAEMLPAIVICKNNLARQWFKQFYNWVNPDALVQIIESSKDFILPKCHCYVISYDLLRRLDADKTQQLASYVKTIIIDECQHIKNVQSQRSNNVRFLAKFAKYILALSGTPIKNHAGEYFSILNILKPERFATIAGYEARFVDNYWNGFKMASGGLKNEKLFREYTDDFIIRFEQKDVLPDLPELIRDFRYLDIDKDLKKAYDKAENELVDFVNTTEGMGGFEMHQHVLAYLTKMRQITAVAKVGAVVDDIQELIENTENEKVIVFLHHHIARDILLRNLDKLGIKYKAITSSTSPDNREKIKVAFGNPLDLSHRVLVLGTLSSGEGLDGLQESCNNLVMMERQWNPPNEEQAEKRLHRIGQKTVVRAKYPIAIGTVDELFTELVEKKRQAIKQTMGDSDQTVWDETSTVKDLLNAIIEKRGGKKWSMAV